MTTREVKITCRHCGSDQITHAARYIVRTLILESSMVDLGLGEELNHDKFGGDELVSDSCEPVDYPYDCKGCNKPDMVESDLLIDGKDHPDYYPEEPE